MTEALIRGLIYAAVGFSLLAANIWFVTSVRSSIAGDSHVVRPFVVIAADGEEASERAGVALAQMAVSRLATLQYNLRRSQRRDTGQAADGSAPAALVPVTSLFVPRAVDIPTSLFEPIDIKATVAGVEIGGLFAWLRQLFASDRALKFTIYQREDRAIISADLGGFAPGVRHIWINSGKDPDEIATNAAYALIWLKLREKGSGRISELDIQQFRELLETITAVDDLNRQVARGHLVETRFLALLPPIETRLKEIPRWPELIYLAASIADGAANNAKAITYYRALAELPEADRKGVENAIFVEAAGRIAALAGEAAGIPVEERTRFVLAASEFARQMSLPGPDPEIIFVEPRMPGVQAIWDEGRFEVSVESAGTEGLPQYVALMGRFMARNYERCFGDGIGNASADAASWNEFRISAVGYLIQSEPAFKDVGVIRAAEQYPLYRAFKRVEAASSVDATRRLVLELMERFDCDWTLQSLAGHMVQINRERGLMEEGAIAKARVGPQPRRRTPKPSGSPEPRTNRARRRPQ